MPRSFDSVFYGAAGTPTGASDDEFNSVSFLSHFEGSNNGVNNAFDDGSASNHTITATGNVTQGSFGPFARPDGEWGVSFDGDSDYLQVAASSDFDFGTGDFTFECSFFKSDVGDYEYLMSFGNNSGSTSSIGLYIDDQLLGVYNNAAISASTTINLNKWYHVAVVRISSTLKIYLDGVEIKSASVSTNISSPGGMNIANWRLAGDAQYFNGVISNARVVKGTGVYTGNFTPPTGKLTAITNTKLLTCQSNRFVDNSATGHTVTAYATSAITAFGPFLTSAVYDAAVNGASNIGGTSGNNYISAANSTDWQFGAGNFTVEFWTYPLATGNWVMARGNGTVAGTSISWQYGYGTFDFYFGSSGGDAEQITSPTLTLNSWQYITVVRNGATITVYKDGVSTGTANCGTKTLNTGGTTAFYVGAYPNAGGGNINGYLSDVRVVKGTAVYTSNFTPPTAPLTAITNTKLLLNMANGQAFDSAAQNNLTLAGNANTSTDQAKFGNTSLHLDGTGDYAEVTSNMGAWGTGNFTVEGWYYLTALAQNDNLFDFRTSGNTGHLDIYFNDDPLRMHVFYGGGDRINANAATPTNQWVHIALVRNGSTTTLYQNGASVGTSTTVVNFSEGGLRIGNRYAGDYYIQGYVDDFRVSKMARYTSNFTAPSAAFADKGK